MQQCTIMEGLREMGRSTKQYEHCELIPNRGIMAQAVEPLYLHEAMWLDIINEQSKK